APVDIIERPETMLLDGGAFLFAQTGAFLRSQAQCAEASILLVAPGAAGDLRHFSNRQTPVPAPVEFIEPSEGHMRDVHVKTHADGIGGNEVIDLAPLE